MAPTLQMNPTAPASLATGPHPLPDARGDEVVAGYGVMGQPFASGDVLALRVWPSVSFSAPYIAVWHRSASGRWTLWSDRPPETSCARYYGAGVDEVRVATVHVTWPSAWQLHVRIEDELEWLVSIRPTLVTRVLTVVCGLLPDGAWRADGFLGLMGRMAGPLLGAGRLRLAGRVPNGQWFQMAPRRMWAVDETAATVDGVGLGPPGPLGEQAHLADTWLPQRGLLAMGSVRMEAFDPVRHLDAAARR